MIQTLIVVALTALWVASMFVAFIFGARVTIARVTEVYFLVHKSAVHGRQQGETIQ